MQYALLTDAQIPAQVLVHAQIVTHRFNLHRRDMNARQLTGAKGKGDAAGVAPGPLLADEIFPVSV